MYTVVQLLSYSILSIFLVSIFDFFIIPGVEPTPCECELQRERDMNLGEEGEMFNFITNFFFQKQDIVVVELAHFLIVEITRVEHPTGSQTGSY